MGVVEYGAPQLLSFDFNSDATAKLFNQINKDINPTGIYTGFDLSRLSSSSVSVSTGVCYIEDATNNVGTRIQTSQPQAITVSNSTPYIILRFVWENTSANYMDMLAVASGDIGVGDLIVGRCVYNETGTDFSSTFDLTRRSIQSLKNTITRNSYFCTTPTEPPSRKVNISSGILNSPQGNIIFPGGTYPSTNITDTTNGRNDILYIDFDGSLKIEYGIDSSTPVTPRYGNKKVVAEIRRGAGRTNIKGNEIYKIISSFDMTPESTDLTIKDIGNYYATTDVEDALQEIAGSNFTFSGAKTFNGAIEAKSGQTVSGPVSGNIQTLKTSGGTTVQYNDINGKLTNTVGTDLKISDAGSVFTVDKVDEALNQLGNEAITLKGIKTFNSSPVVPDLTAGDNSTKAANAKFVQSEKASLEAFKLYSSTYTYGLNDATFYNGVPYKSLIANNINNTPETSATQWEVTGGGTGGGGAVDAGYTLSNGNFDSNISGWTEYDDGASDTPTTGATVATLNFLSLETDEPLIGAGSALWTKSGTANRIGKGFSSPFTIDTGKTGILAQIKFIYKTTDGYTSGDMGVFVYDITNEKLMPIDAMPIAASYGQSALHVTNFMPNSNSTSYRLIFHIRTGNVSDYTLTVDDIVISSRTTFTAPAITPWVDYPAGTYVFTSGSKAFAIGKCPIGATATNPDKGTSSEDHAQWMREGQDMLVKMDYKQTTTGGAGSGIYLFAIPMGNTIDLTKNPIGSPVGFGKVSNSATEDVATTAHARLFVYNSTTLRMEYVAPTFTSLIIDNVSNTTFPLSSQYASYRFTARFTCAQFSVNSTFIGVNEPFYLSNSETAINTNGVVSKTKIGIDGSLILAHTTTTYFDMTLPRTLLPNETASLQVRNKTTGAWMDLGQISVPLGGIYISIKADQHYASGATNFGMGLTDSGSPSVLRVAFNPLAANIFGTSMTWATLATYFDAWRVRIGQASTGTELAPTVFAEYFGNVGANGSMTAIMKLRDTHSYMNASNEWIVPMNGVYTFSFGGSAVIGGTTTFSIVRNGTAIAYVYNNSSGSGYSVGSANRTTYCNKDDKIVFSTGGVAANGLVATAIRVGQI